MYCSGLAPWPDNAHSDSLEAIQRRALCTIDSAAFDMSTWSHSTSRSYPPFTTADNTSTTNFSDSSNTHPPASSHYFRWPEILALSLDCMLHQYTPDLQCAESATHPLYIMDYRTKLSIEIYLSIPLVHSVFTRNALCSISLYFVVYNCCILSYSVQWNLWIHSLGASTCLTLRQHQLTSIRIFCCILLPCSCSDFAQNVTI